MLALSRLEPETKRERTTVAEVFETNATKTERRVLATVLMREAGAPRGDYRLLDGRHVTLDQIFRLANAQPLELG